MACATLKRSLDWSEINQRATKRRRCHPFESASGSQQQNQPGSSSKVLLEPTTPSPFSEVSIPKLTPEKMAENIREEIRRLNRRKQLQFSSSALEKMQQDSESSGSEMGAESPRRPDSPPSLLKNPETALFTFKQVGMICERLLKEQEHKLREEYETILNMKLAEQYDCFVKFTYDQIQKRFEAPPSYLS